MIATVNTPYELAVHASRIKRCSSCNHPIVWFQTTSGNWMPVNAQTVTPADTALDLPRHISHFATCPDRDKHRRRRG